MVTKSLNILVAITLLVSSSAFAQRQGGANIAENKGGTSKQIKTIIFSGVAGAILGLSTLSFYGRPQERLSNIAVGFAIGIIAGAAYTTYKAASQPRNFYNGSQMLEEQDLLKARTLQASRPPTLGYTYSF